MQKLTLDYANAPKMKRNNQQNGSLALYIIYIIYIYYIIGQKTKLLRPLPALFCPAYLV